MPDLRVLTWNIHAGVGTDKRFDLPRVVDLLATADADVIGLQEVDRHYGIRSEWLDLPARLAAELQMGYAFAPAMERKAPGAGRPQREFGNLLLTRRRIVGVGFQTLPAAGERRVVLAAGLDVDGRPLHVLVTHLEHAAATDRLAQAQLVCDRVAATPTPHVLLGDLNAEPESAELNLLTAGLRDAWFWAGEGDGLTCEVEEGRRARIDYVLASPDVEFRSVTTVETDASDHDAVLAELTVAEPPPVYE